MLFKNSLSTENVGFAIIVISVLALLMFPSGCSTSSPTVPEKVSIGYTVADTTVLLMIAQDQNLLAARGLDVTLKPYETALAALAGMKNGEVDVAENAEFPIVSEAFKKMDISILASVDRFDIVYLAGRHDRGIQAISDLKGKTIGSPKGAIAEFYLGRFLDLNGISIKDVNIVNLPFAQAVSALPGGSTDAFQIRFRDIADVKAKLGGNVVIWPVQNGQMGYDVLSARNSWISSHGEIIKRFLISLKKAQEFIEKHPLEAQAIIKKNLNYSDEQMAGLATQHVYALSLYQSMIVAMEDEARWMIGNGMTSEKNIPDFLKYVYLEGLQKVEAPAVNIIH
jgi:ABC-type nitrate/sulfonate/bicarbonate transport system substrate-binding protein